MVEENEAHNGNEDDKLAGYQLYGRFHAYYLKCTSGKFDLQAVHLNIIQLLNEFSSSYA